VIESSNGREALTLVAQEKPDLMLLDLLLPDVDGFAVVDEVRNNLKELARLPILIVTARELSAEDRARLQGRAQALLQKQRLTQEGLHEHLRALGVLPT
jgi:CheY-like chemotaxis protein